MLAIFCEYFSFILLWRVKMGGIKKSVLSLFEEKEEDVLMAI